MAGFLATEIVAAILSRHQPVNLTAETLIKRTDLPLDWDGQKARPGVVQAVEA
jgi:site-specific DNA recombinase